MVRPSPFVKLSAAAALLLGFLAGAGCDRGNAPKDTSQAVPKPEAATPESPIAPPKPAVAKPAEPKSAEPNSFDEVATRLDRGGSLYFYLSTEQWLAGLSEQITLFRDTILSASETGQTPQQREQATQAFKIFADLVKRSGLEEVSGVGASSIALEPGVYRNKLFLHHYAGKGTGMLWSVFGKTPHKFAALDFLPADTALASFMDVDLAQFLDLAKLEVGQLGMPEVQKGFDQGLAQLSAMAGMPVDQILQSLGGGMGIVLTLDSSKPVTLPMEIDGKKETIPAPRLALVIKVKDDRIFKQIDKAMASVPQVERIDESDVRMRTVKVPEAPIEVRATAAQWGNYLILASDDQLVRNFIAASKSGTGFKASPEFAKLSAGLPAEGNGFQLVAQRFADTMTRFQGLMMKNQPGATPEQTALMEKLFAGQKPGASFAVSGQVENGWLVVGKGTYGAGQMMAPLLIAPAAVAAGFAMPAIAKTRQSAKATQSMSQEKQIATACRLYAADNKGKFPPALEALVPDYLTDAKTFISPFAPEVPVGYTYNAGLTDASSPTAVLIEDKFSSREHKRIVVHVDMSAEVLPAP